jgi:hypothetical protein
MNQQTTTTFVTLLPVEHDGKKYPVGKPIELTFGQAEGLKAINAIALPSQAQRSGAGQVDLAAEVRAAQERLGDQAAALGAANDSIDELKAELGERDSALQAATQELTAVRADAQAAAAAHAKKVEELQAQLTKAQADLAAKGAAGGSKAGKAS